MFNWTEVNSNEKALVIEKGELKKVLGQGSYSRGFFYNENEFVIFDERDPWIHHDDLDSFLKTGLLTPHATTFKVEDSQRAGVWIDGHFEKIVGPGNYALWNRLKSVKVEVWDIDSPLFEHSFLDVILNKRENLQGPVYDFLEKVNIKIGKKALLFENGKYKKTLDSGEYAFWKEGKKYDLFHLDLRVMNMEVSGQEIMTLDKVTLRLNLSLRYQITDPLVFVLQNDDTTQALYKEAQFTLREIIGKRDLDNLLAQKEKISEELLEILEKRIEGFGLVVKSMGIKDIILPGEMKEILNKVIEAKKTAEANLIVRREEVAATRGQSNTAKMMENNPVLIRLKELEVLEKISKSGQLNIFMGDKEILSSLKAPTPQ